jgi:hypothetical protein
MFDNIYLWLSKYVVKTYNFTCNVHIVLDFPVWTTFDVLQKMLVQSSNRLYNEL